MIFLPHTNTVILLEPYCGTITEPGLPVVKMASKTVTRSMLIPKPFIVVQILDSDRVLLDIILKLCLPWGGSVGCG